MSFQSSVNLYPAPGVEGARASNNVATTVVAGPNALVAGTAGVRVGSFAWNSAAGLASNFCYTGLVPDGFIDNEQQALITVWLAETSMIVPAGVPVTEYERGDFWAVAHYNDATVGNKVFANLFTGKILAAATGAFPVDPAGTTGVITASFATNVMTVTAGSVYIAPGMHVTGTGIPANTYIEAQLTGTPGACSAATYSLSTYPGTVTSAATVVVTAPDGVGGATASACTCASGDTAMTITTLTNGTIAAGQLVKSPGNVHDLIKIGIKN